MSAEADQADMTSDPTRPLTPTQVVEPLANPGEDDRDDKQPGTPSRPGGQPEDEPDGTPVDNPSGATGQEVSEPDSTREAEAREGTDPA